MRAGKQPTGPLCLICLRAALFSCSIFASGPGACAGAEDVPQSTPTEAGNEAVSGGLEEIVVTAQRREQKLQDVPISASVVSGGALLDSGKVNLSDISDSAANVKIVNGPATDFLNVRGVGSGNNPGFEQAVATFVDDVYRGRSIASREALFDIERVEVLKGPQTTFFGNNAVAGALNITTRKPSLDKYEFNASGLYAPDDGQHLVEGGVSVPLSEHFAFRIAGQFSGMKGGYINNTLLGNEGPDLGSKTGRASILWEPLSNVKVEGRLDVLAESDTDIFDSHVLNCPPDPAIFGATPKGACARYLVASGGHVDDTLDYTTASGPSTFDFHMYEPALHVSVDLGNNSLDSFTSYYRHTSLLGSNVLPAGSVGAAPVTGQPFGLPTRTGEKFHQWSQELRFQSTQRQFIEYMAGAYVAGTSYSGQTISGFFFTPFGALAPGFKASNPIANVIASNQSENTYSAFGSSTINFSSDLRLNLGLRYSIVHKIGHIDQSIGVSDVNLDPAAIKYPAPLSSQIIIGNLFGDSVGQDFPQTSRTDKKLMPSASLQYNLTPDVMSYVSYSTGFKAGGFTTQSAVAVFKPETVDSYEIGTKMTSFDHRLDLNIALFWSVYKDLQEATYTVLPSGAAVGSVANVAQSTSKGIELTTAVQIARPLTINADVAYLSAKYDDYPVAPCTAAQSALTRAGQTCTQDLSGKARAYAPQWSGNVGPVYTSGVAGNINLRIQPSLHFTSGFYTQATADDLLRQGGYAKVDARVAVGPEDRRWEVAFVGTNLTNKVTTGFFQAYPSSPGTTQAVPDPARSLAVQCSVRY